MFSVIEYFKLNSTHANNKDVIIHYYTNNKQKAIHYISGIANLYNTENNFEHIVDITQEDDMNNLIQAYTSFGHYVKLLTCINVPEKSQEELMAFKEQTLATMMHSLYGIPLLEKYEDIKNEIVEFIPLNKLKEICVDMAYYSKQCIPSDKVFAVIELQEL